MKKSTPTKFLATKLFFLLFFLISVQSIFAALVTVLPGNNSTSGNGRAPQGSRTYINTVYLITPAEMTASGFGANIISSVGWTWNAATSGSVAQSAATTGNIKVYVQSTTDATYTKGATFSTAGMTKIIDGTMSIPASLAAFTVDVPSGGTGTSVFTTTAGQGLYIAFEYQTTSALATPTGAPTVYCNTALGGSLITYQSQTVYGTTPTAASGFRPETRLGNPLVDYANITNLYAMGKSPIPFGNAQLLRANVKNEAATSQTYNVTFTVTDQATNAVRYTNTIPTTIAAGATTLVSDNLWTATIQETDIVTVSVPTAGGETVTGNNTKTATSIINGNTYNHCETAPITGGLGYNLGSGLLLAKYHVTGCTEVTAVKVNINGGTGNTVYGVLLNAAGTILAQSPNYVIQAGDINNYVTFTFPTPTTITNADYYIGLAQTANTTTGYYPLSTQAESPARAGAFYGAALTGGAYTEYTTFGRFMIEAVVTPISTTAPINSGNISICAGGSATLTVSGATPNTCGTYSWFSGSCGGTFEGTGASITVSPIANTTYYVRFADANNSNTTPCSQLTVSISSASTSNAGSNQGMCQGATLTLAGSVGGSATGGTWDDGGVGGTFSPNATTLNATYTPPTATTGNVTMTLTTSGGGCPPVASNFTLNITPSGIANAGFDASICRGGNTVLNGGISGAATTGTWNDGAVGGTFTPNATTLNATYTPPSTFSGTVTVTLVPNSVCTINDAMILTVQPYPVSTPGPAGALCQGNSITLSGTVGGSATGGTWSDGAVGGIFAPNATALNATYTPPAAFNGTATLTLTTSGGLCAPVSATKIVTVNSTEAPTTVGDTRCGPGQVTLTASASSGTIRWYTVPTGGTSVFTGTTYTPTLSATTTYYVEQNTGSAGYNVGKANNTGAGGQQVSTAYLVFDVTQNSTLQSVTVYPNSAGNIIIQLLDNTGTLLQTFSYPVTAGNVGAPTVVPVNFSLTVGTGYRLAQGASSVGMFRNSAGVTYPYTCPIVSITGASVAGFYYFFYNWVLAAPCASPRTAVTATINPSTAITLTPTVSTICSGTAVPLSVSSANTNYTYSWYPAQGLSATSGTNINATPTTTTTYNVIANDATTNCQNIASVAITVNPDATANAGSNAAICQGGSTNLTGTTGGATTSFVWDDGGTGGVFSPNTTTLAATYTPPAAFTGNITLTLTPSGGSCAAIPSTKTLSVNTMSTPTTVGDTRCGTGVVNLSASGAGGTMRWFATSTGVSAINTGTTYNPSVSATTTYYVEEQVGSGTANVGKVSNIGGGGQQTSGNWLIFDVLQACVLKTVTIYPGSVGDAVIELRNSSGTTLHTVTYTATAANVGQPTVVTLNLSLPVGTGFQLAQGLTSINMYRNNAGVTYPYSLPGTLSITGSSAGATFYYFYYNWVVETGCVGPRVPVTATVTPADPVTVTPTSANICPGSNTTLTASSLNPNYTYNWSPATGLSATTGASVTANPTSSTVYTITAVDAGSGCQAQGTATVTAEPIPPTVTTVSASPICAGSSVTLTATSPLPNASVSSGTLSLSIPDGNLGGVFTSLNVTGMGSQTIDGTTDTVIVTLNVSHTYNSDLHFYLIAPGNFGAMMLIDKEGASTDNFVNTVLNTSAATSISGFLAPFTGTFKPEGNFYTAIGGITIVPPAALSALGITVNKGIHGAPINGNWTLFVMDDTGGDLGFINNWSLTIKKPTTSYTHTFTGLGILGTPTVTGAFNQVSNVLASEVPPTPNYVVNTTWTRNSCTASTPVALVANPSNNIPMTSGEYYATNKYTDASGWTHYCNCTSDLELLAMKRGATSSWAIGNALVQDSATTTSGQYAVRVNVGSPIIKDLTTTAGYTTVNQPWIVMNRTWDVFLGNSSQQPTSSDSLNVRSYYNDADFAAVSTQIPSITAHNQLTFYKLHTPSYPSAANALVNNHALVLEPEIKIYNNSNILNHWTYGTWGTTNHYGQYMINSFSGGGGGGANNGFAPLPINLQYFVANYKNHQNVLNWETAAETNNDHFEILKSADGLTFMQLGTVASKAQNGSSTQPLQYEFKDNLPFTKTWYQLKQVDINGSAGFSPVVEVVIFPEEGVNISLFPNPTSKDLNVLISANQTDSYVLTLTDLAGKTITSEKIKAGIGNTYHRFEVEKLPQGVYLLSVTSRASGNVFTQKWVKM